MAVEPKTKADREKMSEGLQRLAEEDPTFRCFTNEETGQLIIAGMGELHLEIIRDRLFREFKVEANAGAPQIAYRETITKAAEGEGKFIRQSGGRGQYGHACVTIEPNERGKGVEIENKIVGGAIPKEYIPAVIDGVEEAIARRRAGGLPDGGRQGRHHRRHLPRSRFQRTGLQDGRHLRPQGRGQEGQHPSCSSRS